MYSKIVVLALCLAAASATEFRNCTAGQHHANRVEVSGCDTLPCDFIRGTDLISQIYFTSPILGDNLYPVAMVKMPGLPELNYPFTPEEMDACAYMIENACPIQAGTDAVYELIMPILEEYPLLSMTIEFTLMDPDMNALVCVELDGRVRNP